MHEINGTGPRTVNTLLEVDQLQIRFGAHTVVHDLSFAIEAGQTLALVGESGCGKSATALALMQLLPAPGRISGGSIRFAGQPLLGLPAPALRNLRGRSVSMIFQEPMTSLNPVLPVGYQIAEVLRHHQGLSRKAARAQAIELLDLVRVPAPAQRVDAFAHNLSGGQRQRVMIAMAIACKPQLLIADEPTTALDVTTQAEVLALLDDLRRELSMALLLITHDLGLVEQWADRVVVMYAGRKMEEARVSELFAAPAHPYTRGLLDASLRLEQGRFYRDTRLTEIPGSVESARLATGCPFAPRCAQAEAQCLAGTPRAEPIPSATLVPGVSVPADATPHRVACVSAHRIAMPGPHQNQDQTQNHHAAVVSD
ncbi:ABC transporter ATP-binding protein [Cupriavidus sp. PET2-C1]